MEILSVQIAHFPRETKILDFYGNYQILKSWQQNQMFETPYTEFKKKKKIQLLISKVTLDLKLNDPCSFITEKQSVCKTES